MNARIVLAAAALLALAACAPVRMRGDAGMLAAQTAREQTLAGRDHWTLQARLAVSDGHDGGSGSLTWVQDGARYDFTVRAPVTGRSFRLRGGPTGAVLEGLDGGPLHGIDGQTLLARALGWQVPLGRLREWVMGLRAGGSPAQLRFGENGLPSQLQQDDWTVEYRDWFEAQRPVLPRKVFARRGDYRVKVSIERWALQ